MYRALYRKWRPLTFADVIGQPGITSALQNQISHSRIGHAYIFTGTRGTGKTTCAKIFAKAVNCLSSHNGDPCGQCAICQGIDNGSVLDVVEIDAASNNGVDNIRDLRDETAYTPSECTYKVYIIDEVHMLSSAAFNALLKIMEEPPSHVIFILATTEIHKVPATILSRCQRYDFGRISIDDISQRLEYVAQQESLTLSPTATALIARLADGAMRDALSILDTCAGAGDNINEDIVRRMAGVTDNSYLFDISEAIAQADVTKAMLLIADLREKSVDIKRLTEELVAHYRDILLYAVGGAALVPAAAEHGEKRYAALANKVSQPQSIRAIRAFSYALDHMGKGTDARIELELAVFNLCAPEPVTAPQSTQNTQNTYAVRSEPVPFTQATVQPKSFTQAPAPIAPATQTAKAPSSASSQPLQELATFAPWQQVIDAMQAKDKCLYVNMNTSKAYYDGRRVLIDASDLFLEYMRTNEFSKTLIKDTIAEITGQRCAIGPYPKPATDSENSVTAMDTLNELKAQGVDVVISE